MVLIGVLALCAFAVWMIRRDTGEVPKPIRWTLGLLRIFAIVCAVVYLLNPGQRSESRLITNSRLAVLIDTSLSMGLPAQSSTASTKMTRMDSVLKWITNDEQLNRLRQQHDLSIYRFGDTATPVPVATWTKEQATPVVEDGASSAPAGSWLTRVMPMLVWLFLVVAIGFAVFWLAALFGSLTNNRSWLLMSFVLSLLFALVLAGITDLAAPEQTVWDALRFTETTETLAEPDQPTTASDDLPATEDAEPEKNIDWAVELRPQGTSTTIGAAIQFIINKERGGPLAGVVVISDGQSNSGLPLSLIHISGPTRLLSI